MMKECTRARHALAIAACVMLAATISGSPAAEKQGGGAFPSAPTAKQANTAPSKSRNTDGAYRISGIRTVKHNKLACLSSYNMTLVVRNGRATHKLPFGHTLQARTRGNQLLIASAAEEGGGHWIGRLTLPRRAGRNTSGFLKWVGDGSRCEFAVSVSRQ